MPRAYSNDLRRKFLQAYDEGQDTLEELAEQFRVSLSWAKKISARRSSTGEVDAPVWRHGPLKPSYSGGAGVDPKANSCPAGYDAAGIARATGRGAACAVECGADVVGPAAAGVAT